MEEELVRLAKYNQPNCALDHVCFISCSQGNKPAMVTTGQTLDVHWASVLELLGINSETSPFGSVQVRDTILIFTVWHISWPQDDGYQGRKPDL